MNHDDKSRNVCFAFLWALAGVFHHLSYLAFSHFEFSSVSLAIELLSAASIVPVLLRPGNFMTLVLMAALHVIGVWVQLPFVSNHTLIFGLINLALLISFAVSAPGRGLDFAFRYSLEIMQSSARWVLIVLYASAAFYKFNWDYLTSPGSCARLISMEIQQFIGISFPEIFLSVTGPTSWAIEAGLAILLLIPRVSWIGVVVALVFHWVLAIDAIRTYFNFTALVWAILFCFAPNAFCRALGFAGGSQSSRVTRLCIASLFSVLMLVRHRFFPFSHYEFHSAGQLLWFCLSTPALFFLLKEVWHSKEQAPSQKWQPLTLLIVCIAILNGLSPILGIRSGAGFDMYSNVRMEGKSSNHLLLGSNLDLFGWTSDLVTVESSNDPVLAMSAKFGWQSTYFEFRSYTAAHPDISVNYRRGGQSYSVERVRDNPELSRPWPYLLRKFIYFRTIYSSDDNSCGW